MKTYLKLLLPCLVLLSCDTSSDLKPSILGFWSRETVYLNGVNSVEYVDFLNNGTNFLELKADETFARAYDLGRWNLSGHTLTLDRDAPLPQADWSYGVIRLWNDELVVEIKLTEGQYCCGFDEFDDDEIITIREVYKRLN
jgi:hypothetical protein